jgi:hypothetical protein
VDFISPKRQRNLVGMPISTRRAAARKAAKARRWRKPLFYIKHILQWADHHFEETGRWPNRDSGRVRGTLEEKWSAVDAALHAGLRGLPGGDSLARVLARYRGVRNCQDLPRFTIDQILAWADSHFEETGRWPRKDSGRVGGTLEKWTAVDAALNVGLRGLPGGDSLARVLARYRGVRNRMDLPPYTIDQILTWADAHFNRHGAWPHNLSGPIEDAPGETWTAVGVALSHGKRGLPGGSSLSQVLAKHRGRRNRLRLPSYSIARLLKWADAHQRRTGMWPVLASGPILEAPGETWLAVDKALRKGSRGMRGGSSLPRLLRRHRGVALKHRRQPPLTIEMILAWADAHHDRTGKWPNVESGEINGAPGETWGKMQIALRSGKRGLPRGSSLAELFAARRGVRNVQDLPDFSIKKILDWADAHFRRHGRWPTRNSGPLDDAPGETWNAVTIALARGTRGLPGGSSLARLLAERRGVRNLGDLPKFTIARILAWADAYHERTGMWPHHNSGPIPEAPDETWLRADQALRGGIRGMRGGSSLSRLLQRRRGVEPKHRRRSRLTIDQILTWADAHHRRHGHWPRQNSGAIPEAPGESWGAIDVALRKGSRELPKRLTLGKLWAEHRGVRNVHSIPKFSIAQILKWADAHHGRVGAWPQVRTGPIFESPDDNWFSVENALRIGLRGLPGGSSLKRLLDRHRRNGKHR